MIINDENMAFTDAVAGTFPTASLAPRFERPRAPEGLDFSQSGNAHEWDVK